MNLGTLAGSLLNIPDRNQGIEITGLTADSRRVEKGFLFAAFAGTHTDGARFVDDAVRNGAGAVLIADSDKTDFDLPVPVLRSNAPRSVFAKMAAQFYGQQPSCIVAITGTNGKTSVASFVRQIWQAAGHHAASLGTVGLVTPKRRISGALTTPDPVTLHKLLAEIHGEGVTHLALEASSHGLQQHRLDGVAMQAGAFTNISRDHMDYHKDFEDYRLQKSKLFSSVLGPGKFAVIDLRENEADFMRETAVNNELDVLSIGVEDADIQILEITEGQADQHIQVRFRGKDYQATLPLIGRFQVANALTAVGLCIATGVEPGEAFQAVSRLQGEIGRLEFVGRQQEGGRVFIDYAHTPDALGSALSALRPYVQGKLVVVFGCGGDRDQGKRSEMGRIATSQADRIIVTDDNPRSENPAQIRSEILHGTSGAIEIGDRRAAIEAAISELEAGDILLIAGKGHETGQIVGDKTLPFSDHEAVQEVLNGDSGD
ncbi:MAG: UDP-N-acetylmuramoyl-L-alanyl-D-glutamate--2,6-diaminopimelate ligase [Methyloligellaceae bacterium]